MLSVGYHNTTNTDSVSVYNRLKNFIEQCFSLAHNLQLSLLFTELELKNRGQKQLDPFTLLWSWKRQHCLFHLHSFAWKMQQPHQTLRR